MKPEAKKSFQNTYAAANENHSRGGGTQRFMDGGI
jgi:hypothetical protein